MPEKDPDTDEQMRFHNITEGIPATGLIVHGQSGKGMIEFHTAAARKPAPRQKPEG